MKRSNPSPLFPLLIQFRESLISRDFILDYFAEAEFLTREEVEYKKLVKPGKIYSEENELYVVTECSENTILKSEKIDDQKALKLSFYDRFELESGMIENFTGTPIETTLGVYLLNYVALVKPFGNTIPYVNGVWKMKEIEKKIAAKVINKEITPKQVFKYIDYIYSLSSLNDICVPALTEKAITARPEVTKRRDELLAQYKDQLNDPNIMMRIEEELITLDRKLMADDPSSGFMIKGKNFDVQRKRMFIMMGIMESFGDDIAQYNFGTTNLNDGWKSEELPILVNDIRKGSYERAKSTALGGAESKMLGRNFQDSTIVEDDCQTERGLRITLDASNKDMFIFRNIIEGKKVTTLTPDIIESYLGKQLVIRSPMYCKSSGGYCYTCMDSRFKQIGIKLLNILPVNIGSTILLSSMKKMHGTKASLFSINDINSIVV